MTFIDFLMIMVVIAVSYIPFLLSKIRHLTEEVEELKQQNKKLNEWADQIDEALDKQYVEFRIGEEEW